ncbi:MAG: hypothetical protein KY469_14340 [Actinobacteria bacterium]|nr:hypothetical protein [Actinomycetota bacterium]
MSDIPPEGSAPFEVVETAVTDDAAFQAYARERGWSDGLPMLAPTVERVEAMLATVDAPPDHVVATLAPSNRRATLADIAANAVMAGGSPDRFPVAVAAIAAVADPAFNLEAVQTTTHTVSTLVFVNGPVRGSGFNSGAGMFGTGNEANATTGRAVRLCLQNIGGARSPNPDRSTQGSPAKFTYCGAEAEEDNPWEPLHVQRGFAADVSTVTVFGGESPHNIQDHVSTEPAGILHTAAGTIGAIGSNNVYYGGEILVLLCPEHAATIADGGWTRNDVQGFLFQHARNSLRELKRGGMWGMQWWPEWFYAVDEDALLPVVREPEDLVIVVAGGPGKHSSCVHSWGATRSVTRPVLTEHLSRLDAT